MRKVNRFKVVLVGDQNVGKTSIISRFIHDSFELTSNPTVGIDFLTKTMQVDGQTMRLQLWDTAGQQRFRSLIPSYVRDSDCCLIVLDVSSRLSFEGVNKWIDFVRETRGQDGLLFLVGNKIDLEREIQQEQVEAFAQKIHVQYQEVSAKNSTNISLLFRKVAENLVENKKNGTTPEQIPSKKSNQESEEPIVLKKDKPQNNNTNCSC